MKKGQDFFLYLVVFIFFISFVDAFSGSGAGTLANPYIITTCLQLNETGLDLSSNYSLGNDIDCTDTINWQVAGFSPIGKDTSNYFGGTFNGNGYEIRNLYINSTAKYIGLFGVVQNGNLNGVELVNYSYIAQSGNEYVGGLVSYISGTTKINGSSATGNISAVSDTQYMGGLVGASFSASYIINSYSIGRLSGHAFRVGGLLGYSSGSSFFVNQSYSFVNISNTYTSGVTGGFVGAFNSGRFYDNYARGNVTATSGTIAGFVSTSSVNINTSYSTGAVTGSLKYAFCGSGTCNTVTNSFWDNQTAGTTSNGGGTGKNTTDMKTESTFTNAGWDFTNIWAINSNFNDGYPYLRWQSIDNVVPEYYNFYDNNGTLNNSGIGFFNVTINNTNGTVIFEISGINVTATNLTVNVYNVTYNFTTNGTYTYKWKSWGNGSLANSENSNNITYAVNYLDINYPIFYDYEDNTNMLTSSGMAWFNVTINNTNGTVWLNINNNNYTATNLTSNLYNVSVSLSSPGTYSYRWYAYGNGSDNLENQTTLLSYIINSVSSSSEENESFLSKSFITYRYDIGVAELNKGYKKKVYKNTKIFFEIYNESYELDAHSLEVRQIIDGMIKIIIRSKPKEFTLSKGEEIEVSLGTERPNLRIKILEIDRNSAEIELKNILLPIEQNNEVYADYVDLPNSINFNFRFILIGAFILGLIIGGLSIWEAIQLKRPAHLYNGVSEYHH